MTSGDRVGANFLLEEGIEYTLGREAGNHIVLADPLASRLHCLLRFEDGAWRVVDRSRNGTFVNDQKIDDATLADGHRLRIGSIEFQFHRSELRPTTLDKLEALQPEDAELEFTVPPQAVVVPPPQAVAVPPPQAVAVPPPQQLIVPTPQSPLPAVQAAASGSGDVMLLYQLSLALLQAREAQDVIRTALPVVKEQCRATFAGYLCMNDCGQLQPRLTQPPQPPGAATGLSDSLTAIVAKEARAVWLTGQQQGQRPTSDSLAMFSDAICVPLVCGDEVDGALHLYRAKGRFRESDLEFAISVGHLVSAALCRAHEEERLNCDLQRIKNQSGALDEIVGESPGMVQLKEKITKVARATGCALVRGESGTGKELVARALHRAGPRAARPMLAVNCAAIPESLLESHLFGHVAGAFTGADQDRPGLFEQADMGTLFLDEIGELPLGGQAKLLRVLEGHPFQPVGGDKDIRVDVRLIAATNQDLETLVREKKFREDLMYRLAVFELFVPPLRERGADLDLLIDHFLEHFRAQHGRPKLTLNAAAREKLHKYPWPGNVRQLRNVIDSAVVLAGGRTITPQDLPLRDTGSDDWDSLRLDEWERRLITEALRRCNNSVQEAAEMLGIGRATLYRKIEEYQIERASA